MSGTRLRLMEWTSSWLPVTHIASVSLTRLVGPLPRRELVEQESYPVCAVAWLCGGRGELYVAEEVEPALLEPVDVVALVVAAGTCRRCAVEACRLLAEMAPEDSGVDPLGTPSMLDMLGVRPVGG